MIFQTSALVLLLMGSISIMAEEKNRNLFNFTNPENGKTWVNVNDNVMGGVSDGKFKITQDKTLLFYGNLSLANNGGFSSIRCRPTQLKLQKNDSICFLVKGDGREYTINLYTNKNLTAFSYRQSFQTTKDKWVELSFPLEKFVATSFGKVIQNAGPINPEEINSMGFMLSDKKAGGFQLEIKSISVDNKLND